jgi:hypothetical protein
MGQLIEIPLVKPDFQSHVSGIPRAAGPARDAGARRPRVSGDFTCPGDVNGQTWVR